MQRTMMVQILKAILQCQLTTFGVGTDFGVNGNYNYCSWVWTENKVSANLGNIQVMQVQTDHTFIQVLNLLMYG